MLPRVTNYGWNGIIDAIKREGFFPSLYLRLRRQEATYIRARAATVRVLDFNESIRYTRTGCCVVLESFLRIIN